MSEPEPSPPEELALRTFRRMLLARTLEDKISALYHAGKIVGGVYLGKGQEAFSASLTTHLKKGRDIFGPLIRDQAGRLAFGEPLEDAARTYFGSAMGPMRGRDGNIHRGRPSEGIPAMISHLGSMVSVVAGMLVARRFKGTLAGTVGAVTSGDGGTSTGAFHEGLNMAAVEKLPLVVSVANNQFAYSTPTERQYACENLVARAAGYGIEGHSIDATNFFTCLETFATAVARARAGHGPQLVVGSLLRLAGHGEHDDASYVTPDLKSDPSFPDCLTRAAADLIAKGYTTETELADMRSAATDRVQAAVAQAQKEPSPDPYSETWHALKSSHLTEGSHLPTP
ncbi:MAG: thiamine pyrophosphate-dependent dehydrogenase E1 component subunit alpha [Verrucomicrobiales bacterium]|nr:thiamine pyrophosphate-dependent dehydrogenase E1 component subunit alpha [Verrucomicrobiales bacterium]